MAFRQTKKSKPFPSLMRHMGSSGGDRPTDGWSVFFFFFLNPLNKLNEIHKFVAKSVKALDISTSFCCLLLVFEENESAPSPPISCIYNSTTIERFISSGNLLLLHHIKVQSPHPHTLINSWINFTLTAVLWKLIISILLYHFHSNSENPSFIDTTLNPLNSEAKHK